MMVDTPSIFLVLTSTLFAAVGSFYLKKGVMGRSLMHVWRIPALWGGGFFHGLALITYITALKNLELSLIYPLVSITYIWTTILAVYYLGEKINFWKIAGLAGILLGVMLIGIGA
jgi:drug/metabolite transporter (DMT)-like permease